MLIIDLDGHVYGAATENVLNLPVVAPLLSVVMFGQTNGFQIRQRKRRVLRRFKIFLVLAEFRSEGQVLLQFDSGCALRVEKSVKDLTLVEFLTGLFTYGVQIANG